MQYAACSGRWQSRSLREARGSEHWLGEDPVQRVNRVRGAGRVRDRSLESIVEVKDALGLGQIVGCLLVYSLEKEAAPARPIVVPGNCEQTFVVLVPVGLEVRADVEDWLLDDLALPEKQGHKHTADPAIPVEEGMEGFEFGVEHARLYQEVRWIGVDIAFPPVDRTLKLFSANRHVLGMFDRASGRANPVWYPPIDSRRLVRA